MPGRKTAATSIRYAAAMLALAVPVVMAACPKTALAHNVRVFAHVEGDSVTAECSFHDGKPCRDSLVEVFDGQGTKLLDGRTDAEGRFVFRAPARADMLIRLSDSMGHMGEYKVHAADLPESLSGSVSAAQPGSSAEPPGHGEHSHRHGALSEAEIEEAVEKAVSWQLAPIRRAIEESRRERRFLDVVGGIGYIVGLMGLFLYFRGRRRQD